MGTGTTIAGFICVGIGAVIVLGLTVFAPILFLFSLAGLNLTTTPLIVAVVMIVLGIIIFAVGGHTGKPEYVMMGGKRKRRKKK